MSRVLDRTYDKAISSPVGAIRIRPTRPASRNAIRCRAPEYMRLMRKRVKQAGVTILDHLTRARAAGLTRWGGGGSRGHPAPKRRSLDGACKGGRDRHRRHAFLSETLGSNVLTGDGYLHGRRGRRRADQHGVLQSLCDLAVHSARSRRRCSTAGRVSPMRTAVSFPVRPRRAGAPRSLVRCDGAGLCPARQGRCRRAAIHARLAAEFLPSLRPDRDRSVHAGGSR